MGRGEEKGGSALSCRGERMGERERRKNGKKQALKSNGPWVLATLKSTLHSLAAA